MVDTRHKITLSVLSRVLDLHGGLRVLTRRDERVPKPNELFELSVEDIELIEAALRHAHGALSLELHRKTEGVESEREPTQRKILDLLGRLHNQKIFYRPKNKIYFSG
jgi:signal transduction protein with GAF and PtsI domain